jgi:hypothetical protein
VPAAVGAGGGQLLPGASELTTLASPGSLVAGRSAVTV